MNEEEFEIVETMEKYGGSFVQALSMCFKKADSNNFQKLKRAFPDYWNEYEEMYYNQKTKQD